MPRLRTVAAAVALGVGLASGPVAPASSAEAPPPPGTETPASLPSVYPVPRSMEAQGPPVVLGSTVAVLADQDADPAAVRVAQQALEGAGIANVERVSTLDQAGDGDSVIAIGRDAARAVGTRDASELPAEGYVLTTGRTGSHGVVALDGRDATGTFYAAQTLRQLVGGPGQQASVPGVDIRDWPAFPLRGTIEGFYGTPWSHQARLSQLDFYGAHKMNTYVYSPKDDPYLREKWRDPYPAAELGRIEELVERSQANHVRFTYAISPGLSVCYSSEEDKDALIEKFQTLWDVGVRDFAVPLDDISYQKWNCAADGEKFGTGGAAAGTAQAHLVNAVQRDFIETHPGAARLQTVPTEYYDTSPSPYKEALKTKLDPDVIVEWTGVGVVASQITGEQAAAAKDVFGHSILVWDNYPVNDYATDRLFLGPYVGRDPGLSEVLHGITANPMNQAEASKLPLFNVADYTWNDTAYDAERSWQASITELAGGDPQARAALAALADLGYSSTLDPKQAPVLEEKVSAFWRAGARGDRSASAELVAYLKVIEGARATLGERMHNPAFVEETGPWLESAQYWAQSAQAALRMLAAERDGDGVGALAHRKQVRELMDKARSVEHTGMWGKVKVSIGSGVLDQFVSDALAENDRWLTPSTRGSAMTSLPTYQGYGPAAMLDGQDSTFFWSAASVGRGDYVGVDLGAVQPVNAVSIHMGKPTSTNDYVHSGVLEYSQDGTNWTTAGTYTGQPEIQATLPPGTTARYVRLRATQGQEYWLVVREFRVTGSQPVASGTPAPAAGSSLASVVDGTVDTTYRAASTPGAGDALVVDLPEQRPLDRVTVVGTGAAAVQVRAGEGEWRTIGSLDSGGLTELPADGVRVDAIRLQWTPGSPAPVIAEVAPWYTDAPAAQLRLSPATADAQVGAPTTVTATLSAVRPTDVRGLLAVTPPSGVTASPASSPVLLRRGGRLEIELTLTATAPGTHTVPVTFTPHDGPAVTEQVTLRVR
ncbi:beta-N-acetylglucosaminidase domain-containing protein [Wenjunlia vitaminophila]|uniref:beta-N-acetylglucosaminidase domain-containing protein n=1 Tax=Wenjunlia vitaminophila TaxID=76728 RepID=UPI0003796746|nr:beta-N-acetylglucosaminidase domain-containing protein [Wenjunlia vitaminophila]